MGVLGAQPEATFQNMSRHPTMRTRRRDAPAIKNSPGGNVKVDCGTRLCVSGGDKRKEYCSLPLSPRPQANTSLSLVTARTWEAPHETWTSSYPRSASTILGWVQRQTEKFVTGFKEICCSE